jgi:hypothetical protein
MSVEGNLEYSGIYQAFSETEYGQLMSQEVRYAKYMPEGCSNEEWRELLGADVNQLQHLHLTYGLTKAFINRMDALCPGELSDEDKTKLKDGAISHDMAESVVTDISYGDKTADDEAREVAVFEESLNSFLHGSSDNIIERIKRAKDEVVFNQEDKDARLSKMFNAIERVGYLRTALRAHENAKTELRPDYEESFEWIVADVFGNHIEKLLGYAREYPPVWEYLHNMQDQITEAFTSLDSAVFDRYAPDVQEKERAEFCEAWLAWTNYLEN